MRPRDPSAKPSFGSLLRTFRIRAELSQEQLAEAAGISVAAISTLERGTRRAPHAATFDLLARALALTGEEREELAACAARVRYRSAKAAAAALTGFPAYLTSFIGRERELDDCLELAKTSRLVSIVGVGGAGKTRLVCEVARRIAHAFDVAYFVDLSAVRERVMVFSQVAHAVGVTTGLGEEAIDAVATRLATTRALLVIDNCEHLIDAAAFVAIRILGATSSTTVIATSRERLAVAGEIVFRLDPLSTDERRGDSPALCLFFERASAADRSFAMTAERKQTVRDICVRLDGLPLAIELTAARLPSLGLHRLAAELDRHLSFPSAFRDAPGRHATMQAAMAWSFETLSENEQTLLCRCAVFAGGFTLDAIRIVCTDERITADHILPLVVGLTEKSLLTIATPEDAFDRYDMLVTVRLFSDERLRMRGDFERVARKHAAWLADIADVAETEMRMEIGWRPTVDRMKYEIENIRIAVDRMLRSNRRNDILVAARIVGGFRGIWIFGNLHDEARTLANRLLPWLSERTDDGVAAPIWKMLLQVSDIVNFEGVSGQALELFRRVGDRESEISLCIHSVRRLADAREYARAKALALRADELLTSHDNCSERMRKILLRNRSHLYLREGRLHEALLDDEAATRIGEDATSPFCLIQRSMIEAELEQFEKAKTLVEKAIDRETWNDILRAGSLRFSIEESLGNHETLSKLMCDFIASAEIENRILLGYMLHAIARYASRIGAVETAATLQGHSDALESEAQYFRLPFEDRLSQSTAASLRERLSPAVYEELYRRGSQMKSADIVRMCRDLTSTISTPLPRTSG